MERQVTMSDLDKFLNLQIINNLTIMSFLLLILVWRLETSLYFLIQSMLKQTTRIPVVREKKKKMLRIIHTNINP